MANAGAFVKGEKRPNQGRPKGCKNKATQAIKDAFRQAFDDMGGVAALVRWGKKNPNQFYPLAAKLIPTEVHGAGDEGEHLVRQDVEFRIVDASG